MWSLSLAVWLAAGLPALLCGAPAASSLLVEGDNDPSRICKPAPHWQASKIGDLRDKLRRSNLTDVSFMVVNEREAMSRAMYWELRRRAPPGVPVYQQAPLQDDVWEALDGDKDDFLVYDRCGRLTFHIVLPYSFLHYPYIEAAIRATYLKDICNCSDHQANSSAAAAGGNETLGSLTPQGDMNHTDTYSNSTMLATPTLSTHDHGFSHTTVVHTTTAQPTSTAPSAADVHRHLHQHPHDHQHQHHHHHHHQHHHHHA